MSNFTRQFEFGKSLLRNVTFVTQSSSVTLPINDTSYAILCSIDNKKTTKEIFDKVRNDGIDKTDKEMLELFLPTYECLNNNDLMFLRLE